MKKKTLLITFILVAATAVTASEEITSFEQSSSTYSFNDQQPLNISVETNTTEFDEAHLETNETGEFENHTVYNYEIDQHSNGTDILFRWDNDNDILRQEKINYTAYIHTENTTLSRDGSFNTEMTPEIHEVNATEQVTQNQIVETQADILHPIGTGRINTVELEIEKPDGETETFTPRTEDSISEDHLEGYEYVYEFVGTDQVGEYTVTFTAEDDYNKVTETTTFEVQERDEIGPQEVNLNPAYIGQASIAGSIASIPSIGLQNIWIQLFLGLIILTILTGGAIILGDAGAERNDFTT